MPLMSYLFLLSVAQLIVAPPSIILPNSTTVSASWNEASNISAPTRAQIATSTSPDQQEFLDLSADFKDYNHSLSLYCLHIQESAYLSWKTTNTQATSIFHCTQKETEGPCDNDGTYTETVVPDFTPTMKPPCCGQCFITASRAHALFWPTPALQPNISTLVGLHGFTYTSPSVYVVFDQLIATNRCGHAGSVLSSATIPFQQWQVSSMGFDGMLTSVNFANLTNCSTTASSALTDLFGFTYDPCHPTLQYDPSYLSTLQPEWATCVDVGGILYDPPRALTSASALNSPQPQVIIPTAISPSLTSSATPGAYIPQGPSMTDPHTGALTPKSTQTAPSGRGTRLSQESLSISTIQSSAGLPDPLDPSKKPKEAGKAGQVSNDTVGDPEKGITESVTSTSQASAVIIANTSSTPRISSSDASRANGSSKDPNEDPPDPSDPSSLQPLLVGGQKITVPVHSVTALKVDSQTLNTQTPIPTISNAPISLGSDKLQIGTPVHSVMNPTPTATRTIFTIDLNPQGDRTEIKIGRPGVTVAGTRVYLRSSKFVFGNRTETFAPATSDPVIEAGGDKGGVGAGNTAKSGPNATASATTGPAGIGGALISGLWTVGGGVPTTSDGSGRSGNGSTAAPFLGAASKTGDNVVDLWVKFGLGLVVVVCLTM